MLIELNNSNSNFVKINKIFKQKYLTNQHFNYLIINLYYVCKS